MGAAQRDGRRLIVVLLRGEQLPVPMWMQAARLLDYGFALPAGTKPVGVLVEEAPPSASAPSTAPAGSPSTAVEPPAAAGRSTAAGNGLLPLAALVTIALAVTAALWLRRRAAARGRE